MPICPTVLPTPTPFDAVLMSDTKKYVISLLTRLSEREKHAVINKIVEGKTYKQLANEYGVSLERARQIVQRGLMKMRFGSGHEQYKYEFRFSDSPVTWFPESPLSW